MNQNNKLRLGGHVSTSGGLNNAVKNTLAIGGNCMQIFAGSPRMWARKPYDKTTAESFKQLVRENDVAPVYIHALYLTNLASDKPDLVTKSTTALITDMTNSSAIASAGVVLHIGSHQGRGWASVKNQVVEQIKFVLDSTPEDSILLLENSAGQKGKIGSLPELGEILQLIPTSRLQICLDTAHAFEAGYELRGKAGVDKFVQDIDTYLSFNKLALLHLNDSKTKLASGHDMHANIGEGYIGDNGLKYLLNHPKLVNLPLILEVPGTNKSGPDKKNVQHVLSLLGI